MAFAEELIKNRKLHGFTQESLAEKCNVSRQAVAKWEKGDTLPDIYTVAKLAKLFGILIEELIWSKQEVLLENRTYYIQKMTEDDQDEFMELMHEHRWFGGLLKTMEELGTDKGDTRIWDTYSKFGKTFNLYDRNEKEMIGYYYLEGEQTSAPQISLQFRQGLILDEDLVGITRDILNMLHKEYHIRAALVYVNTGVEIEIFEQLGYENVAGEVTIALPV